MGASSGIGRATAARFAANGAKVVVAARGEAGLRSLVEQVRADGGDAVAEVADVTDPAQMRRVAQRAVTEYGGLDTWVHAAGVLLVAPFDETTPEEFQRVIDVNLMGQVHGAMAALPHLKQKGGALIHIPSTGAKRGVPLQSAYSASEHGIDGLVETLRMEVQRADLPISVTNVIPATINSPLFDQARTKIGVKPVAPPPIYQPDVVVDSVLYGPAPGRFGPPGRPPVRVAWRPLADRALAPRRRSVSRHQAAGARVARRLPLAGEVERQHLVPAGQRRQHRAELADETGEAGKSTRVGPVPSRCALTSEAAPSGPPGALNRISHSDRGHVGWGRMCVCRSPVVLTCSTSRSVVDALRSAAAALPRVEALVPRVAKTPSARPSSSSRRGRPRHRHGEGPPSGTLRSRVGLDAGGPSVRATAHCGTATATITSWVTATPSRRNSAHRPARCVARSPGSMTDTASCMPPHTPPAHWMRRRRN
ncbi:SDR family oxidoreductase [Blastococcus sp. SYSU DS0510]